MTSADIYYDASYDTLYYEVAPQIERSHSRVIPVMLIVPVLISLFSWMGDGIPILTDVAFGWMTMVCTFVVCRELTHFSRRFGIGSIVLYGGTLTWFCQDYFSHWFGMNFVGFSATYPAWVVAKGAFFTCLFVFVASIGLLLPTMSWMEKLISYLPEATPGGHFGMILILLFVIGFFPFVFFTADSLPVTLYKAVTGMRSNDAIAWTVGRDGRYNYSWGGYLAQVVQIGEVGGILAAVYAILVPIGAFPRILCLGVWLFWAVLEFGGGSRGPLLAVILPIIGMIWIKYATQAFYRLQRFSKRVFFYTGVLMFVCLLAVQIQGSFRNEGLRAADVVNVDLFKNQGNTMFTEGLMCYQQFPDTFPQPYNTFVGEGMIRCLPSTAFRFAIGWIPRAIWTNKPGMEEAILWLNERMTGGSAVNGHGGGTIAPSISANSYMFFGAAGVVEMALLFGYLCRCVESCLQQNLTRVMGLLMTLGVATWLFRCFRDFTPHNLYPLLIGGMASAFLIRAIRIFSGPAH